MGSEQAQWISIGVFHWLLWPLVQWDVHGVLLAWLYWLLHVLRHQTRDFLVLLLQPQGTTYTWQPTAIYPGATREGSSQCFMSNCWICTSFVAAVVQGAVRVRTGHGESATASTRAAVSQQREMGEKGSKELVPCKQVLSLPAACVQTCTCTLLLLPKKKGLVWLFVSGFKLFIILNAKRKAGIDSIKNKQSGTATHALEAGRARDTAIIFKSKDNY